MPAVLIMHTLQVLDPFKGLMLYKTWLCVIAVTTQSIVKFSGKVVLGYDGSWDSISVYILSSPRSTESYLTRPPDHRQSMVCQSGSSELSHFSATAIIFNLMGAHWGKLLTLLKYLFLMKSTLFPFWELTPSKNDSSSRRTNRNPQKLFPCLENIHLKNGMNRPDLPKKNIIIHLTEISIEIHENGMVHVFKLKTILVE